MNVRNNQVSRRRRCVTCDVGVVCISAGVECRQSSSPIITSTEQPQQTVELCRELELGFKTKQLLPEVIIDEL